MGLSLAPKTTTFSYPVIIPVLEGKATVRHSIEFTFRKLSRTKFSEITKDTEVPRDIDGNRIDLSAEEQLDYNSRQVMALASDWKGVTADDDSEVDFTADNIKALLDNYPNALNAIIEAYIKAAWHGGEVQRKN